MPPAKPILLALTLLTAPAHPQSPTDPTTLKVYSRETIVDTTVTDKKGDPVHGLERIQLHPQGRQQASTHPRLQGFSTETPATPPPKLPPNVYTNLQPPAPSNAVNILLIDLLNIASMPGIDVLGGADAQGRSIAAQNAVKRRR